MNVSVVSSVTDQSKNEPRAAEMREMTWKNHLVGQNPITCAQSGSPSVPEMTSRTARSAWPDEVETSGYCTVTVKLPRIYDSGNAPNNPFFEVNLVAKSMQQRNRLEIKELISSSPV